MAEPTKFWLVWSPSGPTPPKYRHASEWSAEDEAKRLAAEHVGKEFYVLEVVGRAAVEATYMPIAEVDADQSTDLELV